MAAHAFNASAREAKTGGSHITETLPQKDILGWHYNLVAEHLPKMLQGSRLEPQNHKKIMIIKE